MLIWINNERNNEVSNYVKKVIPLTRISIFNRYMVPKSSEFEKIQ